MNPPGDEQAAYIDGYQADFPESDPQSAASYQQLVKPVFEFEIPPFAKGDPFFARSEIFFLPDVTVSHARTAASRFIRTIRTIAERGNDQILVVCYTRGHFTMTKAVKKGGETKRVEAGELAFIDLSQEIVIEAPAVENVSLAISRRRLEAMLPVLDDAHCFVREQGGLSGVLRHMMEDIIDMGPTIPVVDARAIGDAIIQLVAACLEPLSRPQMQTGSGSGTVSLVAVKAEIERRLSDAELRPQALIDEFGITRSTLYRLFEPLGGVSAYITERRLHYAFRLLTDPLQPRRRISQLAFVLGFSHASAFTRAFRDLFEVSPKDVRALAVQSKVRELQLKVSPEHMQYLSPIRRAPDRQRVDMAG